MPPTSSATPSAPSSNSPGERGVIVLRIAEIFLKGGNRRRFFNQLVRNARRLLDDLDDVEVEATYLRVLVHYPQSAQRACIERLNRLFGVSSMSPAIAVARDLDALKSSAIDCARRFPAGTTFKVESRRRDKSFPMTSQEISKEVGTAVAIATELPVDVRNPERTIHVEVGREQCYVFGDVIPGPGGLPIGTAGRVALLLSGGIDSPVAGWSVMRRGCTMSAIYFHSFPYTGDKTKEKVLDIGRILARWQGHLTVRVVHFTDVQKKLREHGPGELAVLLYRRMMMRAASELAKTDHAAALVTGENLGQVASQTLQNMGAIEASASLPVLRPLLTYDKQEIVARARDIGTFETSILPYDDCCSLFVPKHPATRSSDDVLTRAEEGLDIEAMTRELVDGVERIDL